MTDTAAPGGQEPAQAQPQAGTPQAQAADAQQPQAGSADGGDDNIATLRAQLTQARQEAAGNRTKLRTFEEAKAAADEAGKTELQRATERQAELERELASERTAAQGLRVRLATVGAAQKLGFRNPAIAHQLVPMEQLTFDDAGEPTNLEALLAKVAKAEPYLVGPVPDFGGGPRGQAREAVDMNTAIRRAAGRT